MKFSNSNARGFGDDSRDRHQQRQFEVSTSAGATGSSRKSLGGVMVQALHHMLLDAY